MTEDVHATQTNSNESKPATGADAHDWNKGNRGLPTGIEENPVDADDENTGDDITYEDATGSGDIGGGGEDG